jgi:hypothetical protein
MKYLLAIVVSALALAAFGYEAMWRTEHSDFGNSAMSPDGEYVAQFFLLPEGSVVPYGMGAHVRYRYVPFWSTSTLVFAGYCDRNQRLYWRNPRELVVECKSVEGTPQLFPAPGDVVVTLK